VTRRRRRSRRPAAAAVLLAVFATGCMVGPNYHKPSAPVAPDWLEYEDPRLDREPPVEPGWWHGAFQDPVLDQLIQTALEQNLSLRSAGLRVLQAQQQLAIALGNRYPQVQQVTGEAEAEGAGSEVEGLYNLGFNLSWEADVWGRFRRQIESASAALDASVAGYDGVMVSLIASVAQNYLLVRTTQQRIEVARQNIEYQEQSVQITTAKFEGGEVSGLDVDQAESLLYNTKGNLASLEQSLQQLKNALAVLLGQPPHDMSALLGEPRPIPTVPAEIALGMPQDLIRRRPDIRVAERQLAAQSAQIGFAITDLYPQFTIGGGVGTAFEGQVNFNLFGVFKWNIFNYGRLKSNVRLQDAVFQQLLEDYRETVLQAQGEVENAIVAYLKSQEQVEAYQAAEAAAQRAAKVSSIQYVEGEVDFNTVINTLSALEQQQDLLAATQGAVTTNLVDVYKSLGGGWEVRQGQGPVDLIPEKTKQEMRERTGYWDKLFN
jgi:NodT family efflux transporter outer membrane factor (OMF) lipoprotein